MSGTHSKRIENYIFEIKTEKHTVFVDASEKSGGTHKYASPHDLVEIALSGCTAMTMQMYANRKGMNLVSSDVQVKIISETNSKIEIERVIRFEGNLSDEEKNMLLKIADKCPVHKILATGAQITTRLAAHS